jgi:large subunit ribosomal protein L21
MVLAVVKTGGKQYLVSEGDVLAVEKLAGETGAKINLDEVLLVDDGKTAKVGTPTVSGAVVEAEIVDQFRDDKVIVFKMKRRKRYRKTQGHRQNKTQIKILSIA